MMGFPLKITLTYALFSILWVTTSDNAVNQMFRADQVADILTYKGWFFIAFTSIMLLLFLIQETRRRNRNEATLATQRDSINKLSQAVSQSPVSIIVSDLHGQVEYVNDAFERMSGFERSEVLGSNPRLFNDNRNPRSIYDELWQHVHAGEQWEGELLNKRKDGSSYWVHARISPVHNETGGLTHFLAIEEDITQRKSQENRIKHQANYDSLTELPNRFLAMDRMSQAINNAIRHEQAVVLMFIDLDNFKHVNDSLGHDIGDQLITLAAARISETVRQTDTVARYGGDEFLVILNHIDSPSDAPRVAEKILASLSSSFFIEDKELEITASIGIAVFPEDGQDPYELLRNADAAMFAAKDEGGNRYEFCSADVNKAAAERMQIEAELRHALEKQELSLHFQPLVDLSGGRIEGAEVLLRWSNAKLGDVAPDRFIPLAEATGLIIPIGDWVIINACKQLKQWHDRGMTGLRLMINLSPRQFRDTNLQRTITSALDQYQLDGSSLELEVTEGLLVRDQDETRTIIDKLRSRGIRIALDDFGSGSSSLNSLKNFSFDTLKIDRAYINELLQHSDDKALVNGTVTIAKGLGLKTVGEGVETTEQYDYLKTQGVDQVQGFLFTPALPAAQFEHYYDKHGSERASG